MPQFTEWLNKPEYWFQPRQLWRKALFEAGRYAKLATIRVGLPWGAEITVNPHESIGKSLLTYGVYELAVSEILWRLTDTGDRCLDVGANIGYMTSLLSAAAGAGGQVFSFEPHPRMFAHLAANATAWRQSSAAAKFAEISLHRFALGASESELDLAEPERFDENEGGAMLLASNPSAPANLVRHHVQVRSLDQVLPLDVNYGVMKIDVEGAEASVLQGARRLLAEQRIRDIVFEDFRPFPSAAVSLLKDSGYRIFRLAKTLKGPILWDPTAPSVTNPTLPWEPINYLATIAPQRAMDNNQARGWSCLQRRG